jgi:hypothetical protein
LQPLSEQPFDFLDTNASITSGTTDSNSTYISLSQPQLQQQQQQQQQRQQQQQTQPLEQEHGDQDMDEDIWTLDATMQHPTKFNTLSWDTRNSQFPSYEQIQLSERNIGTPFITEAPRSLFEPLIRRLQNPSNTIVIHEAELVKSLIQAMSGLPSIYFCWDQQQQTFKQRSTHFRILGVSTAAIRPVIEQVLLFGTRIKALEYVSQQCQLQPENYGLTGVAFGCCLQELLMHIQQTMMSVFSDHDPQSMTVLKVYYSVQSLATVVEKLYQLCQVQQQQQQQQFILPKGAELLNLLHSEISKFDLASNGGNSALYRDICLVILSYTSVPYSNMMSRWLQFNNYNLDDQNEDPYGEFFIGGRTANIRNDLFYDYRVSIIS